MNTPKCARCRNSIFLDKDLIVDKGKLYHKGCYRKRIRGQITTLEVLACYKETTPKLQKELQDLRKILASL